MYWVSLFIKVKGGHSLRTGKIPALIWCVSIYGILVSFLLFYNETHRITEEQGWKGL